MNPVDGESRTAPPASALAILRPRHHRRGAPLGLSALSARSSTISTQFLVGLTATPERTRSTRIPIRCFDLEDGVPTDAYSLDEAVADDRLVPPQGDLGAAENRARRASATTISARRKKTSGTCWNGTRDEVPDTVEAAEVNKRLFNERHRRQGAGASDAAAA